MPTESELRHRPWLLKGAAVLAAACVVTALLLAGHDLWSAHALQTRLDRDDALSRVEQRVAPVLRGGDTLALTRLAQELIASPALGLRYLAILDADGVALAAAGRYENLSRLSWLPASLRNSLRAALYTGLAETGRRSLATGQDRLGSLEYAIGSLPAQLVREEAVERLRSTGWMIAGMALLFGASTLLLLRLALVPGLPPARRRDAGVSAAPLARSGQSATTAPLLPEGLGETLDALQLGLLLIDEELHVLALNQTAEQLSGWSSASASGQLIYSVLHVRDAAGAPVSSPAELCLRESAPQAAMELRLRPRGGVAAERVIEASATLRSLPGGGRGALMLMQDIGARIAAREELRGQALLAEGVLDQLGEGVLTTDAAGVVKTANARALRMFGYSGEEMRRMTVSRLLPVPFMNTPGIRLADYQAGGSGRMPKVAGWRKDATTFAVELLVEPMHTATEQRLVVIIRDITERLRNTSLAQRLGRLLDAASEEVYIFDAQSLYFIEVNKGARRNLGLQASQLARMSLTGIATDLDPATLQGYLARLRGGECDSLSYKTQHRRADSSSYPVEVRLSFSREEEPPVFMAIALDITEREAAERRMRQLAHFDALTGLPNRSLLFDRLRQAMHVAQRSGRQLAVFFLDLDGFKPVNDRYGHEVGDTVLRTVAERLQTGLRAADTVSRFGGDEFVVLAQGIQDGEDAAALAGKIFELFLPPVAVQGMQIPVRISIGATLYPQDDSDAEGLLRHADAAMYTGKQDGRGQLQIHQLAVKTGAEAPRTDQALARGIQSGLASGEFQLLFQPVIAADGAVAAGIASHFWQHPDFGRISAAELAAVARRSGHQVDLEAWQLTACIAQHRHVKSQGLPTLPALIPISARQWRDPDFAERLIERMREAGASLRLLILLIEREDWPDAAAAVAMIWPRLLQQGLRLAVREPDFEHSLEAAGIIVLPPHYAEQVTSDPQTVERIRRYAALGRPVVAEGVSDDLLRERLRLAGVSHFSGPAVQPALTPTELAIWLDGRKTRGL